MRHSVRARLLLTFVFTAWALAAPTSAVASGTSPVHVDPSSPVAKEYALPLASARGAPPESGKPGKLFGSGITRSSSPPATSTPTPASTSPPAQTQVTPTVVITSPSTPATTPVHRSRPRRHVHRERAPAHPAPAPVKKLAATATPAAYRVLRPGGGSGLLWMALAAAVVLSIGSVGGLLLSRRR